MDCGSEHGFSRGEGEGPGSLSVHCAQTQHRGVRTGRVGVGVQGGHQDAGDAVSTVTRQEAPQTLNRR